MWLGGQLMGGGGGNTWAIGHARLLGEVIVEDDILRIVVVEVLAHSSANIEGQELEGGGVDSVSNDAVVHCLLLVVLANELGTSGAHLTHTNVDVHDKSQTRTSS